MNFNKIFLGLVLVAACCTLSACGARVHYSGKTGDTGTTTDTTPRDKTTTVSKQTGPPSHAPAHGYRYKRSDGAVVEYESELGVYIVTDYVDYYVYKNNYYRYTDSTWQISVAIDGPWKGTKTHKLPKGLQKQDKKNNGKGNSNKNK